MSRLTVRIDAFAHTFQSQNNRNEKNHRGQIFGSVRVRLFHLILARVYAFSMHLRFAYNISQQANRPVDVRREGVVGGDLLLIARGGRRPFAIGRGGRELLAIGRGKRDLLLRRPRRVASSLAAMIVGASRRF